MKPKIFIHRNLYARGIGFSIVREGRIIFNFWLWHVSGCFYFGDRYFVEESHQNRRLKEADERARASANDAKSARARTDWLETVAAYETREG